MIEMNCSFAQSRRQLVELSLQLVDVLDRERFRAEHMGKRLHQDEDCQLLLFSELEPDFQRELCHVQSRSCAGRSYLSMAGDKSTFLFRSGAGEFLGYCQHIYHQFSFSVDTDAVKPVGFKLETQKSRHPLHKLGVFPAVEDVSEFNILVFDTAPA